MIEIIAISFCSGSVFTFLASILFFLYLVINAKAVSNEWEERSGLFTDNEVSHDLQNK